MARRNLGQVVSYLEEYNLRSAVKIYDRIPASAEHLKSHPKIGRKGRESGTREMIVPATRYILVYRITDGTVEVISVLHMSRESG